MAQKKGEMKLIPGGNQMSLIRDTEEVTKFLEFAGRKLILSEQAINCRLTACNTIFSVVNEDEDGLDHILGNLDVLVNRVRNRNPGVQPATLKVYKSRVKSSIEDFKAWSADPFAWERAITDKAKATTQERKRERPAALPRPKKAKRATQAPRVPEGEENSDSAQAPVFDAALPDRSARHVSFPIRTDFAVEMTLPPGGLTLKDMQRIGLFLYPYCVDIETKGFQWPGVGER